MYRVLASIFAALLFLSLAVISHIAGEAVPLIFLTLAVLIVHVGIQERTLRFKTSIGILGVCLLAWLAMAWIIGDLDKTIHSVELRERLETSIGKDEASQFFIGQVASREYFEITSNIALVAAGIFFLYSIFSADSKNNKAIFASASASASGESPKEDSTKKSGLDQERSISSNLIPKEELKQTPRGAVGAVASIAKTTTVAESSPALVNEEELWEQALLECDGDGRKQGLWAKCFASANGNESVAKATYMRERVQQLQKERVVADAEAKRLEAERQEDARFAKLAEEERVYAALPKGVCPCCASVQILDARECTKCGALFGDDSAWQLSPLSVSGSASQSKRVDVLVDELMTMGGVVERNEDGWIVEIGGRSRRAYTADDLERIVVESV